MDTNTSPQPHTFNEHQLTADAYFEIVRQLREFLPAPDPADPDAETRRDNAAIAECAALGPCNPAEARLAARYVICNEQAMQELRRWRDPNLSDKDRTQAFTWSSSLMRQARGYIATLRGVQRDRLRRNATQEAAVQADYNEHCTIGFMTAALADMKQPGTAAWQPPPPPQQEPEPPEPELDPDRPRLTDGELYAGMYPKRAKLIRDNGGMPDLKFPYSFGPPSDEVIDELLTSQSPRILALDEVE